MTPPLPPPPPPPHTHTTPTTPADLAFLKATCRLVLFFFSTKYHQNIVKGIRFTDQTPNPIQTQEEEITAKVRQPELSFLYATRRLVLFYIFTRANTKSRHNRCQI